MIVVTGADVGLGRRVEFTTFLWLVAIASPDIFGVMGGLIGKSM